MHIPNFRCGALVLALAAAFVTGATVADHVSVQAARAATPPPVATTPTQSAAAPIAALPDFSGLVEKYGPTVVNISVVQDRKTSGHPQVQMPDEEDVPPMFRNLPFPFHFDVPHERGPVRGVGSGFILSPDGSSSPTRTWSMTPTKSP